ncbi:MAG: class I SAM-dependent methyltransferase [Roseburia sp.]|nr:class I SAM-dependent methyltransferase [Roseburia sp.]
MEVFKDYAYYYNICYRDKDYKGEAEQVSGLLKKYGKDIKNIINFGCGTGRHDIELSQLGYHCTGIDMSPVMIEIAKENLSKAQAEIDFSVEDIRVFQPSVTYDAVISLFHVMSYQNSNEDIRAAFEAARKSVAPGGIFLFDVWYGPGVLSDKPSVRVKEMEDEQNKIIRIARPVMHEQKNVVDVCYEILVMNKETDVVKTINEVHHMRYFFRPEIELLLEQTGFELIDNLDCQSLGETSFDSWTSYFVARAV